MAISHYTDDELQLLHLLLTYSSVNHVVLKREFSLFAVQMGFDNKQLKDFVENLALKINDDVNNISYE
ncbi:hypothetical protein [Moraxella bovis]|uniref:Uncharacterized protein n=1 Tax=Moraxella bovis TaxID=476 RepID=A0A1S9ZXR3_MORBO|nr:hypothetical protein [Moraxella bovis]OOR88188.1 hypothetical protein B0182_10435 [Moraxella bovis]UZA17881.1 hypothetical protein LP109_06310 [Moraxella bovis]UZA17892.1 hypothetical protein LP109_06365 [Moraxella bovis]UZA17903.1 hypothetical protein LP109_06420 [Moraxella bovis]STY93712.1 Uncharacterised protein [Moraxella bovis]